MVIIGEKNSIPEQYQDYWPLISRCPLVSEHGLVGYLTIQESFVQKGKSQRRPGLHIETPGVVMSSTGSATHRVEFSQFLWGGGYKETDELHGGIYMASNVAGSCKVWNAQIKCPDKVVTDVADSAGHLGDIEHLREELGEGYMVEAGELIWLTDTTPHESLALPEAAFRQFFRLVTSQVSVWYEAHASKNKLGIKPDPKRTRIMGSTAAARAEMQNRCLHCNPEWLGFCCSYCGTTVGTD